MWPRSYHSDDEIGCTSRVAFGDWLFTPADPEEGDEFWERYSNYGAIHCAAVIRTAEDRAELGEAQWKHGFFVRIGKSRLRSRDWELWVLQKGTIPGSEYVLLARESDGGGLIDRFRVLQQRCPPGKLRQARGLDVWTTRYCAIDSRAELISLGRRMVRLPPVGTISRVGAEDEAGDAAGAGSSPAR